MKRFYNNSGDTAFPGDNSKDGIELSGTDNGGAAFSVPFSGNYAENTPGKIIAILPDNIPEGEFTKVPPLNILLAWIAAPFWKISPFLPCILPSLSAPPSRMGGFNPLNVPK
jgi:hypothetical protein